MVIRRIAVMIPMLLLVSFFVFCLISLIPGDAAQHIAGGIDASPEAIEAVREELNLDDPFLTQYFDWLGGVLTGDLGNSLTTGESISTELGERIPVTLGLALAVYAIVIPSALIIGVLGGLRPGSILDRFLLFGSSFAIAIPSFFAAIVLVAVLSVSLGWLPVFGYVPFTEDPVEWAKHMAIPAIALSLTSAAALSRQVRAGLADTMQSAFIRTAWAKGGSTRQVVAGHALKNSAIPAVTIIGLQLGNILGGSVIIEQIFVIPGMGQYILTAVTRQNVPVVQAVALIFVLMYMVSSLLVDVTYGYLNPKVRAE